MKTLFNIIYICLFFSSSLKSEISFNRDIRPILSDKCFSCHGVDKKHAKGDLQLHTFEEATRKLGKQKDRQAVVPNNLEKSVLWQRINDTDLDEIMPPPESHMTLDQREKNLLKQWILIGAPYEKHWSFMTVHKPKLPDVKNHKWVHNAIDHFVLSRMKEKQLEPSPQADPGLLIRRLSLDLKGLPPSPDEMNRFSKQPSKAVWEEIIDEYLESEDFAERLTLEWLDASRYADTNGYSIDDHRDMWGWRDWVIQSFEKNMPYDQFILEQVAGDLLPNANIQQKIATGFLRNSMSTHEGGTIPEEYRVTYNIDKLDTVSTSILGLTIKCAQCHDHKYDPITQKEFYQFYAYFNSSSESGYGGHGNAKPMVSSTTAYCDSNRIRKEMSWRIKTLEQKMLESISDYKKKHQTWKDKLIKESNNKNLVKQKNNKDFTGLKWIWFENKKVKETVELKKTFSFHKKVRSAHVQFTGDDQIELIINGKSIAKNNNWMLVKKVNLKRHLKQGENTILLKCKNNGGLAGALFNLKIEFLDKKKRNIVTDQRWEGRRAKDKNWEPVTVLGDYGMLPWGNVFADQDKIRLYSLIKQDYDKLNEDDQSFLTQAFIKNSTKSIFVRTLQKEVNTLNALKKSGQVTTMIMDHGKRKTFVLNRGQYDQPGEEVKTGVPSCLPPLQGDEKEANRLGLAKWLIRKDHPLTARVLVNRVWQMLMGTGIVETSEDFGSQGSWPTHPKLLDWLAQDFMDHDWDVRHLIKTIVMSSTYKQSSIANPKQIEIDPRNQLLSRSPRYRLPAELIRDQALYISGILNKKIGGPSVHPDQPDGLWKEISHYGYPSAFTSQIFIPGRGKNLFRKSMYTFWKRTSAPPSMTIFDAPTRETCSTRRMTTNTPLQALVLLNDPQFMNASKHFADKMINWEKQGLNAIEIAYERLTGHKGNEKDKQYLQNMKKVYLQYFKQNRRDAKELISNLNHSLLDSSEHAAWTMLASTLFNLDEAITRQ